MKIYHLISVVILGLFGSTAFMAYVPTDSSSLIDQNKTLAEAVYSINPTATHTPKATNNSNKHINESASVLSDIKQNTSISSHAIVEIPPTQNSFNQSATNLTELTSYNVYLPIIIAANNDNNGGGGDDDDDDDGGDGDGGDGDGGGDGDDDDDNYYVATNGSDDRGDGSSSNPWATISHALENVSDESTILVLPGLYNGRVRLEGVFDKGVVVRSETPYQARLRHQSTVVTCYAAQGITLEGFDIAHSGPDAGKYVIQIQNLLGNADEDPSNDTSRIVFRNNVLHDSYNNDLIKVNNDVRDITFEGNMFYNPWGSDSHIDANSVSGIIIQDNLFFNNFSGSGRINPNNTGSYIVIKDSNGDKDNKLGSDNITVRRNIFFNWEGLPGNAFIVAGEGSKPYYVASDILVENNLMLGNTDNPIYTTIGLRGVRRITFRSNTIIGDLPSNAFAVRLSRGEKHPKNKKIHFHNNIWADPTTTMGADGSKSPNDFSDTSPEATATFILNNNLYWNGGAAIPQDSTDLINYTDDDQRIIANPLLLENQSELVLPNWNPDSNRFEDGSTTIRQAFERLVMLYGTPATNSPVVDAADASQAPTEDILGNPRPTGLKPDIGAYEHQQ